MMDVWELFCLESGCETEVRKELNPGEVLDVTLRLDNETPEIQVVVESAATRTTIVLQLEDDDE